MSVLSTFDEAFLKLRETDEAFKSRQFRVTRMCGRTIFVDFYNLPRGCVGGGMGAEHENNRMMFSIRTVDAERLRIEHSVSAFPRTYRLRAKTTTPEKLVEYLAAFLRKVIAEVPPNFTHSKPHE